jgi:hypothetical protein
MRALLHAGVRLYPARWRARYGREFEALLDQLEPDWRAALDVFCGAMTMQIQRPGILIVMCAALGGALAGAVSLRLPDTYSSSAILRLSSSDESFLERMDQVAAAESPTVKATAALWIEEPDATTRSTMLTVKFADRNERKAREVTERLLTNVLAANGVAPVTIRTARSGPNRPAIGAGGAAIGLLFGAFAMRFRGGTLAESRNRDA